MHDPRVGRFFAVDPLAPQYPHNSPYAFSENRVIHAVELEGLESELAYMGQASNKGTGYLIVVMSEDMEDAARIASENTMFDYMIVECIEDADKFVGQYMNEHSIEKLPTLVFGMHGGNHGIKVARLPDEEEYRNAEFLGDPMPELKKTTLDEGVVTGISDGSYDKEGAEKAYNMFFNILGQVEENGDLIMISCFVRISPQLGEKMSELTGNKFNIYLNSDYSSTITLTYTYPDGTVKKEALVNLPLTREEKFDEGWFLYPAGSGKEIELNSSIKINGETGKAEPTEPFPKQ